jgi:hypothetical protein
LYGDVNVSINGDILAHGYPAWQVPETYDKLWNLYESLIVDRRISKYTLDELVSYYDLVVSTAPAPFFCMNEHDFVFKEIEIIQRASYPHQPPNTIVFNAYADLSWVRSSIVFGCEVTEWNTGDGPKDAITIKKPLRHNCDCNPKVFRTGRFGAWHNETWIDTAYFDTYRIITSMLNKGEWESVK